MDRNAFHNLLRRFLDGKCTEEEKAIIDRWYELLDDGMPVTINEAEYDEIENRLWNRIHEETGGTEVSIKGSKRPGRYIIIKWLSVAAVFIGLTAVVYLYSVQNKVANSLESEKVQEGLVEQKNNDHTAKLVTLEDGSKVTLQYGAKIAYPKQFAKNKREVYLEGEAFFEVTKNANRPFFVYNNNLVTEVLGTSFNIKIINNKIEVDVKTGRVAVYENGNRIDLSARQKKENGVIITPNQKVTYYTESRHFITALVDAPTPVPSAEAQPGKEVKFAFDDTPLSEVLASIEKVYGIEIVLENDNLKNCPFTGDITKPSLYNKLEFICQAFQASYEIKGTKILIAGGKGCN